LLTRVEPLRAASAETEHSVAGSVAADVSNDRNTFSFRVKKKSFAVLLGQLEPEFEGTTVIRNVGSH
jgi:hypothetical protein